MDPERLFSVCGNLAVVGWLLLILLPRWRWTARLVFSGVVPLLLSAVYLVLVVSFFGRGEGGFSSLAQVARLFQQPYVLLAGWVHYLAFDLFIGGWELRDSQRLGIPHWVMIPCLILTFLLGPIGLLSYHLVRLRWRNKPAVEQRA